MVLVPPRVRRLLYVPSKQGVIERPLLRGVAMFLTIALVLIVLWALGFFIFPLVGGLIHILLIIAVIAIIWHFIKGRPSTGV